MFQFRSRRGKIMKDTLLLPARFDSAAVPGFAEAMKSRRRAPITLDGSQVGFAGALALQALIACRRQWEDDGMAFSLSGPSQSLLECCKSLGIAPADIGATGELEVSE